MNLPNDAIVNFVFPNNMEVWWSLPIVLYPFMTGLIAGAFVVSGLYHVLKIKDFEPLANFALVTAFCFGMFAAVPLLFHLGQPQRALNILFTPHFTSAMSGFGYLYFGYMILLAIEIWVVFRKHFVARANETTGLEKWIWTVLTLGVTTYHPDSARVDRKMTAFLAGIGIPWAFCLHGYVGFVFGSVKAVSWWATALQPIIFLSSAVVSGMALLVMFYTVLRWRRLEPHDYSMIRRLTGILWAVFVIDWALEMLELLHVSYQNSHEWMQIKPLILGPLAGSYIYGQIIALSAVPTILIAIVVLSGMQGRKMLYLANLGALLLFLQVLAMRYNVVVGGQLISKSDRGFQEFHWEFFSGDGVLPLIPIFLAPFVVYYVLSRFLPIFGETARRAGAGGPPGA